MSHITHIQSLMYKNINILYWYSTWYHPCSLHEYSEMAAIVRRPTAAPQNTPTYTCPCPGHIYKHPSIPSDYMKDTYTNSTVHDVVPPEFHGDLIHGSDVLHHEIATLLKDQPVTDDPPAAVYIYGEDPSCRIVPESTISTLKTTEQSLDGDVTELSTSAATWTTKVESLHSEITAGGAAACHHED